MRIYAVAAAFCPHVTFSREAPSGGEIGFRNVRSKTTSFQLKVFHDSSKVSLVSSSSPNRGSVGCSSITKYQPAWPTVGLSGPFGSSMPLNPKKKISEVICPRKMGQLRV